MIIPVHQKTVVVFTIQPEKVQKMKIYLLLKIMRADLTINQTNLAHRPAQKLRELGRLIRLDLIPARELIERRL